MLAVAAVLGLLSTVPGGATAATTPTVDSTTAVRSPATAHLIVNRKGSNVPADVGFNVFDTGSSNTVINALPTGTRAMVWLGQKCPTAPDDAFRATVAKLASNSRVYGYYLSDEPHVADCPGGPAALAARAKVIKDATAGRQVSFVVLSRREDYSAFRPAVTGVTLLGVNAYPCSVANPTCDIPMIGRKVSDAIAAGIPRAQIVPVLQAFGQERTADGGYYRLPTATQMGAIVKAWRDAVPDARLDYSYGWGNQTSSNPTLVDSTTLQGVLRSYFGK